MRSCRNIEKIHWSFNWSAEKERCMWSLYIQSICIWTPLILYILKQSCWGSAQRESTTCQQTHGGETWIISLLKKLNQPSGVILFSSQHTEKQITLFVTVCIHLKSYHISCSLVFINWKRCSVETTHYDQNMELLNGVTLFLWSRASSPCTWY